MKKTLWVVLAILVIGVCMMPDVSVAKKSNNEKTVVQQMRTVKGTVKGPDGEPLIGVTVRFEGTTIVVLTDEDGKFSIQVPEGITKLTFSYVGYKSKTIPIPASGDVDITMEEDGGSLDENR